MRISGKTLTAETAASFSLMAETADELNLLQVRSYFENQLSTLF